MTSNNPYTTEGQRISDFGTPFSIGYGFVDEVFVHEAEDEYKHVARVQPHGKDTTFLAQMGVMADGDVHPPTLSADNDVPVLYVTRGDRTPVIISLLYSNDNTVPEYEPGERRIGHALSDTHVFFDEDGNLLIHGDEDVSVTADGDVSFDGDGDTTVSTTGTVTIESDSGATVTIQDDGTVSINGGSKGVIHDVTTTTDADGHVTSISLERRDDILI